MDEALFQAWPHMEEWKAGYLHCFHRRCAKNGHVVFYDRLDLSFMSKMVDKYGEWSCCEVREERECGVK